MCIQYISSPVTMDNIPAVAIHRLEEAGLEAFAVGGCVRDTLLGITPLDWDITTNGTPEQVKSVFSDEKVIETGIAHGTVTVLLQGKPLEITTYRIDGGYSDSRHPDGVTFTPSLLEDLKRRDFTVNAMVWHPEKGFADFFDGITDLKNGILRTVGDAKRRFSEDALRILRALRFAATYPFTLDPETEKAAFALAHTLQAVSNERIKTELEKLLLGDFAGQVLSRFSGIFSEILPQVFATKNQHLPLLSSLPKDRLTRLAFLFWETEQVEDTLVKMRWDTQTIKQISGLIACKDIPLYTEKPALCRLLALLGEQDCRRFIQIQSVFSPAWKAVDLALTEVIKEDPCYTLQQLAIKGQDLLTLGYEGKAVGDTLHRLLDAVMDGKCANEKKALLEFLQ